MSMIGENTILYFWNSSCTVCEPLYEKMELLVKKDFPKLHIQKINITEKPDYRAKFQVFTSPLLILLFDGKEYLRSNGNVSIHELQQKIERLYKLKFDK